MEDELSALGQRWDLLSILGDISGSAADMSAAREGFEQLTGELLAQLGTETLRKTVQRITSKAQVAVDIVIRNLFERTADIGFLATDDDIREFIRTRQNREALVARFRKVPSPSPPYHDIVLLDTNGVVLARIDDANQVERTADPMTRSLGAYNEALAIYRRVRDARPDGWFWPSIKMAATHRLMGDYARALRTLDELARRPKGWEGMPYRYHLGWTLVRLGRYADAEATFTVGLEQQPDFGWARVGRACARSAQGKLTEALADLEDAIPDLEPADGVAYTPRQKQTLEKTRIVARQLKQVTAHPPDIPPAEPCRLFLDPLDRPRARSPELPTATTANGGV